MIQQHREWVTRFRQLRRLSRLRREFLVMAKIVEHLPNTEKSVLAEMIARAVVVAQSRLRPCDPIQAHAVEVRERESSFLRAHSKNRHVRLLGISSWIAAIELEVKDSDRPEHAALQRHLARLRRFMKPVVIQTANDGIMEWFKSANG